MKLRDYVFLSVAIGLASLALAGDRVFGPPAAPAPSKPAASRIGDWLAIWWLTRDHAHPSVQGVPEHIVNAPARHARGPDGQPLLDHSAGW